jgi:hypothetical protein
MSSVTAPPIIRATLPGPLDPRWSLLDGLEIDGTTVTIHPGHWIRYENPTWLLCDWEDVRANLLPVTETAGEALEQTVLDYIASHGRATTDPAEVLNTAWHVYSHLFRDELLPIGGLEEIGPDELRMLREAATLMSLNRVEQDGHITNISPTWFFAVAVPLVFGLSDEAGQFIDEAYHGTWFNETRRIESVKAHAALGGRLVHGCQSSANMTGGVVAPYGTDMEAFRLELAAVRPEWITAVRNSAGRNPR